MASSTRAKIFGWVGGIILFVILLLALSDFIVTYLWFGGVDYQGVFWRIKGTQILLFLIALAVAVVYIGINVRFITRRLSTIHLNLGDSPEGMPSVIRLRPKLIKRILYGITFLISLIFAFSWSSHWDDFMRFMHAESFGNTDPLFHIDTGFYVFRLSFIKSIQGSLIGLVFAVTLITVLYYLMSGKITLNSLRQRSFTVVTGAHKQIFTNLGLWLVLLACGFFLDRYDLLFKDNHIIDGANYIDTHVLIPVFWVLAIGSLLLALYSFFQNYRYRPGRLVKGALALLILGIIGQVFLPMLIQNYKVEPSEFSLEEPYIANNIDFTRKAYHLDSVETKKYNAKDTLTLKQIREHKKATQNVRVWDQNLTVDTYKQLQEIRHYYEFYNIDLDRYHTDKEGYRQVLISARELSKSLPAKAQTWVNKHLQYTHGFGAVISPTTEKTEEGSPIFYLKDIPPKSKIGLQIDRPAIYYGESPTGYKLVNTEISEMDYPKGDKNVYTHYDGEGGIPIDNIFKRMLFSWQFGDINILLTDYVKEGSKIQFWRSLQNRVKKIAPFLELDEDPYMVIDEGKLYWIQDAYTTASHYPYAEPYDNHHNYIRNSVKIVVNAYDGSVDFYVANPSDPVIKMYQDMFPKMFKPLKAMPGRLEKHVKYPKDLYKIQLEKYSAYHMKDPQVFYNKEDLWVRPKEIYGGSKIGMEPYYLLGMLPGSKKLEYILISPMTPENRDNMISWMVVKSDFPEYGRIINYELPKERLFLGPAQIEAKINQNTEISRQLSLWDQRGSKVIRGNLMVIPIEDSFLYVEPVFLFSTSTNIPQLKRVIATTGSNVVMEPTLQDAIFALYGKKKFDLLDLNPLQEENAIQNQTTPQQLEDIKELWKEMEEALEDKDWKVFGEKMDKIQNHLEESE